MNLKTLTGAREVLEAAGCPVADLNGAGLESNCPVCLAPMTVTKGDEWVEFGCAAGCGREDVVYELAIRSGQVARPPDTGPLLDELVDFMGRFVVLPSMAARRALALFVLHTWAFDSAYATPYIVVESPEKQSGKTRLLEVLALVCRSPQKVASVTAAALFQVIEASKPTLLIDEADAIFGGNHEHHEALRGVLNAGNMPGSPVLRGGQGGEPVKYDVYCPKVIAGIATGRLPDTIRDRAIVVAIDRKKKSERVERLRIRRICDEVDKLKESLSLWAKGAQAGLSAYELGEPLEKISDRLEEAWEPLLAIAEQAGGVWPEKTRRAAEALAAGEADDDDDSHLLLAAMRDVFGEQDVLATSTIQTILNVEQDLPFGAYNDGKGIKPTQIASLLKRYRIKPKGVRIGDKTPRGYRREWFSDAWERYLPATPATTQAQSQKQGVSYPQQDADVAPSEDPANPHGKRDVADVAATDAQRAMRDQEEEQR